MGRLKGLAGVAAVCYVMYAIKSVVDNSHAPMMHQCVAVLALVVWFGWTVYTIDEKRRNRERRDKERAEQE